MKEKMKIKYIDYGIGNRIGSTIYLNKQLKSIPGLCEAIKRHEYNHCDGWNFGDFMMDLSLKELKNVRKEYYRFIITHPKTWVNYLPFMKIEGKWCFDLSLTIVWLFFIALSIFVGILI